jgi:hypothetical protein
MVHRSRENQKLKYEQVRQLKAQNERRRKSADLLKFLHTFKLETLVPRDLLNKPNKGLVKEENNPAGQSPTADVQASVASSDGIEDWCHICV